MSAAESSSGSAWREPREVRGEFRSIATSVPGIRVGEHMPHSARVVDRLAVVRSLYHPMTNHNAAAFAALSGRAPAKGDLELLANDRNDPPCLGSLLSHARATCSSPLVMASSERNMRTNSTLSSIARCLWISSNPPGWEAVLQGSG